MWWSFFQAALTRRVSNYCRFPEGRRWKEQFKNYPKATSGSGLQLHWDNQFSLECLITDVVHWFIEQTRWRIPADDRCIKSRRFPWYSCINDDWARQSRNSIEVGTYPKCYGPYVNNFLNTSFLWHSRPLRNLVSYLKQKEAAGVISMNYRDEEGENQQGVLYCFPPCEFASDLLHRNSCDMIEDGKEDYLLVVVVCGGPT